MSKKITKWFSLKSIPTMALFTLSVWGVLSCGIGASFSPSFLVLGFVFTSLCAFLVRCSNPSTDTNDTMMPEMPEMPEFLDAFVANTNNQANRVYINNGMGGFPDASITTLTVTNNSRAVALGDLDGDGNLDAFVTNRNQANRIYINNGMGGFPDAGITALTGAHNSYGVALGDLDGDGNLDAFVANYGQANRIYINNGMGGFPDAGITTLPNPSLTADYNFDVALGDLDNDGDLDAFVVQNSTPNDIYINNGITNDVWGGFADRARLAGTSNSRDVALGDLDGDGNLDAFVANYNQPNRIYINDGVTMSGDWRGFPATGIMALTGGNNSSDVALGDLDGDGDLDAFVTNRNQPNRIYINNGMGDFPDADIMVLTGTNSSTGVALGDLDNDGDLDAFVTNNGQNRIYINNGTTNDVWGGFAASVPLNGTNDSRGVALGHLGAN